MTGTSLISATSVLALTLTASAPVNAAPDDALMTFIVQTGRPLQVALDQRITIRRVGQPVTGTLTEPVYAYDRLVLPVGTMVRGHVQQLVNPSKANHVRAMLSGDFSPHRQVVLRFDTLMLDDGRELPIDTVVKGAVTRATREVAASSESNPTGAAARARREIQQRTREALATAKQKVRDTLSAVKQPDKLQRLKELAIEQLPYHPQFLGKGTVYAAELSSPLTFGSATPIERAPAGTPPTPESILTARLVTPLDSSKTPRGTPIEAVVTEPVLTSDHRLILPEGTRLTGEVTLAKPAGRFHHNGQLRFLFERVQVPDQEPTSLLASLYSVQASADDHLAVDDEGGTTVTNPKTRFIAPALAILALRASADHGHRFDNDGDANDLPGAPIQSGNVGSRGLGGFLGFGLAGVALSQVSRPLGIGFAVVGVVRTVYTNVLGKGRDVSFPVDTPIQVQLAPGPSSVP